MRREFMHPREWMDAAIVMMAWLVTFWIVYLANTTPELAGYFFWLLWVCVVAAPLETMTFVMRWQSRLRCMTILKYQPICSACTWPAKRRHGFTCICGDPQGQIDHVEYKCGVDAVQQMRQFFKGLHLR